MNFDELTKAIKARENRVNEILEALRVFAVPDDKLTFVVNPEHTDEVRPFLLEVEELRAANIAAKSAMQHAQLVYSDLASGTPH